MREGFPGGIVLKNPPANAGYARVAGLIPGLEDPLEEKMATYSTIPGKFHGQRSLAGYSPWGCKELDMTEHIHTHTYMDEESEWGNP